MGTNIQASRAMPRTPKVAPYGTNGQVRERKDKNKSYAKINTKRILWFFHKGSMDVFIDTENYSHGNSPINLTITFCTATNTTTAAQRHRLEAKEEIGCDHQGPARLRSFDFGKRNGYLQGVTPIDAQQKNMKLLTFSCGRGSSW